MIKYDLRCGQGHEFEGWFSSSDDYDDQCKRDLVECPVCGQTDITKMIVAPNVATSEQRERSQGALASQIKKARDHIENTYAYVGDDFASQVRDMHDGLTKAKPIYGKSTPEETKALIKDDIPIVPIPDVIAPKGNKLN